MQHRLWSLRTPPGRREEDGPVQEITVGTFTPSVLLDLARGSGRLEEHGLVVHERPVTSSPSQFSDLADGTLDVALTSPDNVLAYRFEPANPLGALLDARIVSGVDRGMGLGLYARPGATAADLVGAEVGVDVPSSGFALALYALAETLGVGRESYELVTLGATPRRLEALLDGRCTATMLNAGNELVAERAGCVCLAAAQDLLRPYLGTVVAVVGEDRLPAARALAAALAGTAAEIVAGGLTDEAAASAGRVLGLDGELATTYVARLRDPHAGLVADGVVEREALANLVRLRTRHLPGEHLTEARLDDPGLVTTW
jgi:ABC-type nitrate/sulfonate/bicarbonate transport system substrate-binding protein